MKFTRPAVRFTIPVILTALLIAPNPVDPETAAAADSALPDAPPAQTQVTVKKLPLAILKDQFPIWTSPVRIRPHDLIWLLPARRGDRHHLGHRHRCDALYISRPDV